MDATTTVQVNETGGELSLFRQYDGQHEPQNAYIELDLRNGTLHATYDAELGGAIPFSVHYGFDRRYDIPMLTGTAADALMHEIAPLADRILADWDDRWDERRGNMVAVLGEDAQAAEEEIESLCSAVDDDSPDDPDMVVVWDLDGATNGSEVTDHDITADTTDARLEEIVDEVTEGLRQCNIPFGESGEVSARRVAVVPELLEHLKSLRDDLAEEDPLTEAELRVKREHLGFTGDHLAKLLSVNPRTLRSWEQGRDPVPGRIRPEIAEMVEETDKDVETLVTELEGVEEPELVTYRDDDEYVAARRTGDLSPLSFAYRGSAAWHRQVCARVAICTGARIVFAEQDDE